MEKIKASCPYGTWIKHKKIEAKRCLVFAPASQSVKSLRILTRSLRTLITRAPDVTDPPLD